MTNPITKRFRGFLPVVVDVETGGLNSETDALLEIAAVTLQLDDQGIISPLKTHACHVIPFEGSNLDPEALKVTQIDPYHPFRFAISEVEALQEIFLPIRQLVRETKCQRAVMVGHNINFDLSFFQAAVRRCQYKHDPFHPFTTFDTATLAGVAYGETVLVKALRAAKISFNQSEAHSAMVGSPNAVFKITFAVFLPTPGSD